MHLTAPQRKELYQALLAAFPTNASLERLVYFELDENLIDIAGAGPLGDVLFYLLVWAEANNRIADLLAGALRQNPHNQDLSSCVASLGLGSVSVDSNPSIAAPVPTVSPAQSIPSRSLTISQQSVPQPSIEKGTIQVKWKFLSLPGFANLDLEFGAIDIFLDGRKCATLANEDAQEDAQIVMVEPGPHVVEVGNTIGTTISALEEPDRVVFDRGRVDLNLAPGENVILRYYREWTATGKEKVILERVNKAGL